MFVYWCLCIESWRIRQGVNMMLVFLLSQFRTYTVFRPIFNFSLGLFSLWRTVALAKYRAVGFIYKIFPNYTPCVPMRDIQIVQGQNVLYKVTFCLDYTIVKPTDRILTIVWQRSAAPDGSIAARNSAKSSNRIKDVQKLGGQQMKKRFH